MGDSSNSSSGSHGLKDAVSRVAEAIAPANVATPGPGIALTGCGAISEFHLAAYGRLGLRVAALCSRDISKANARALEFCPDAAVFNSHDEMLHCPGVGAVDIATHPQARASLI